MFGRDAESVREVAEAFAFYSRGSTLDGPSFVAAARALGFAPTAAEARALLAAVHAAFPDGRLDGAGFVSMLGTVVGPRIPRPGQQRDSMQGGLDALQRLAPPLSRVHVARVAATHGDPLPPRMARALAAGTSSGGGAGAPSPHGLVAAALARYDATIDQRDA